MYAPDDSNEKTILARQLWAATAKIGDLFDFPLHVIWITVQYYMSDLICKGIHGFTHSPRLRDTTIPLVAMPDLKGQSSQCLQSAVKQNLQGATVL